MFSLRGKKVTVAFGQLQGGTVLGEMYSQARFGAQGGPPDRGRIGGATRAGTLTDWRIALTVRRGKGKGPAWPAQTGRMIAAPGATPMARC